MSVLCSFSLVSVLTVLKFEGKITVQKYNYFYFYTLQPVERRSTGRTSRLVFRSMIIKLVIFNAPLGHLESKFPQEGGLPYEKRQGSLSYLLGVKKAVLVTFRLSLKRFTAGVFVVLFKSLSQKNMTGTNMF